MPVVLIFFLRKKSEDIIMMEHLAETEFHKYEARYGAMFEGIDLRKSSAKYYTALFTLRRI